MDDCIFCAIVAGQAEASMVYEDQVSCAFLTIGPVNPGHLLVIPKRHCAFLADLDEETGMHLFKVSTQMAQALRHSGLQCEGINLFLADGKAAFQEVFHVHLHVFPRFSGDPFKIDANWEIKPSRQELDHIAERIRSADQHLRQATQP
ncbi:MAG: HIT family protein [Ktedonobacteraceae bacterium]|nr:HIT family protein [Ktedonobacteraceae bacterium]